MTVIRPLNYLKYSKKEALQELKDKVGYKEYGRKHGESRFTKFFQNYYLPEKFNMDKRRPHLSSLVLSGEISRDEALQELEKPLYDQKELNDDKTYVAKKLGLSKDELDGLVQSPGRHFSEYSSWLGRYKLLQTLYRIYKKLFKKKIKLYSN